MDIGYLFKDTFETSQHNTFMKKKKLKTTENYPCRDNLNPDCEKVNPTNVALTWRHARISIHFGLGKVGHSEAILAWAGYPG